MLTFDPSKHEYRWNGIRVPCVSDALNLLFGVFPGSDPEPARHGTMIHDLCQRYLISFDRSLSTEPEFLGFIKWCDKEKITPFEKIETEEMFYSVHGYAGTRDIRLAIRDWIIDIKTGAEIVNRHSQQLNAYDNGEKNRLSNLYWNGTDWILKDRKFSKEQFRHFLCAVDILNFNNQF